MPRKIFFFIKSLLLSSIVIGNLYAAEISIIPLKKPIFDNEASSEMVSQGIFKPKSKPSKKINKIVKKNVKKNVKKINFLFPKSKPIVIKKSRSIVKEQSKYYSQKDYNIAKKSIQAMEKRQWSTALSLSKIGFFNGIIDISAADILPIIIELNNNDFIKKNIFLGINLLNESLNYVISIYVQRIKCCFNNPI